MRVGLRHATREDEDRDTSRRWLHVDEQSIVDDAILVVAVIVGLALMAGVIVRDTRDRVAHLWSSGPLAAASR
jgi:hypothetical protein